MVDFFGRGGSPRISTAVGTAAPVQNMLVKGSELYGPNLTAALIGTYTFRAASGIRIPSAPGTGSVIWIKVAGVWKQASPYIKVAGVWKPATGYVKVAGAWKP